MTQALYRRYRPETFQEVIGQEHVIQPLMAALAAGKTTHAYLFSGPRGCGKTTSARILARALNCVEYPTDTPCGKCESCIELARDGSGSLDVVELDAASHGGVDDARELREQAGFAPVRDRFKIFIIDEAHMVSNQGFNALLKLVEEPPPHIKFIFATTEPEKVIGTIRSRTHHYPFRLVPPGTLEDYLAGLCAHEGVAAGKDVLSLVVRAGTGSVRDTLSVLDQIIGGSDGKALEYDRAVALLGYTSAHLLDQAVEAISARNGAALFNVVDSVVKSGHDPRRFVEDLLQRLRDLVIIALAGDSVKDVFLSVPDDQYALMVQQAGELGAARASHSADLVNDALTGMVGATAPRMQLELLCARLIVAGDAHGSHANGGATASTMTSTGVAESAGSVGAAGFSNMRGSLAGAGSAAGQAISGSAAPAAGQSASSAMQSGKPLSDPRSKPMPSFGEPEDRVAPASSTQATPAILGRDEPASASGSAHMADTHSHSAQVPNAPARAVQPAAQRKVQPPKSDASASLVDEVSSAKLHGTQVPEVSARAVQPAAQHAARPAASGAGGSSASTPYATGVPDVAPAAHSAPHVPSGLAQIQAQWAGVMQAASSESKIVANMLKHATGPLALDGQKLIVGFLNEGTAAGFNNHPKARAAVAHALSAHAGVQLDVEGCAGTAAPDAAPKAPAAAEPAAIVQQAVSQVVPSQSEASGAKAHAGSNDCANLRDVAVSLEAPKVQSWPQTGGDSRPIVAAGNTSDAENAPENNLVSSQPDDVADVNSLSVPDISQLPDILADEIPPELDPIYEIPQDSAEDADPAGVLGALIDGTATYKQGNVDSTEPSASEILDAQLADAKYASAPAHTTTQAQSHNAGGQVSAIGAHDLGMSTRESNHSLTAVAPSSPSSKVEQFAPFFAQDMPDLPPAELPPDMAQRFGISSPEPAHSARASSGGLSFGEASHLSTASADLARTAQYSDRAISEYPELAEQLNHAQSLKRAQLIDRGEEARYHPSPTGEASQAPKASQDEASQDEASQEQEYEDPWDEVSDDDPEISQSSLMGINVVLDVLGGSVVEEISNEKGA